MKLTKKQRMELLDCLPGVGRMFINLGDGNYKTVDFHLGRNGKYYTNFSTNAELFIYLEEIRKEIKDD